ncbi:MAG: hypothetical protein IPN33_08595 [Saprospiraceae bacterium]|nr:hypothetical protein [Saprospiraceae bacterium]
MKPVIKLLCLLAPAFVFFACEKGNEKPTQEGILGEYIGSSIRIQNIAIIHWDSIQGFYNEWVVDTTLVNPDTIIVYQVDETHIQFNFKSIGGSLWWWNPFLYEPTDNEEYEFNANNSTYYSSQGVSIKINTSKKQLTLHLYRNGMQDPGEHTDFEGWKE